MNPTEHALDAGLSPVEPASLTLLDTEHWLCAARRGRRVCVHVDLLDDQHRRNILAWLRARPELLAKWQDEADYRLYLDGILSSAEYIARQQERRAVPPVVWLEDTPLVRRLVQLLPPTAHPPRHHRHLPARLRGPRR